MVGGGHGLGPLGLLPFLLFSCHLVLPLSRAEAHTPHFLISPKLLNGAQKQELSAAFLPQLGHGVIELPVLLLWNSSVVPEIEIGQQLSVGFPDLRG